MTAKRYQVTGACVTHIPVDSAMGSMLATLYYGQLLPSNVPAVKLKHLLDSGLIAEFAEDVPAATAES